MKNALLVLFTAISTMFYAQECGTQIIHNQLMNSDPDYKHNRELLNAQCREIVNSAKGSAEKASAVKTIPVVFHVMHNYGPENISDAQIYDALQRLNNDFRKMRSDTNLIAPAFKPIHADCEIEFKLAQIDPNGNCTNGITRTQTTLTYNAHDDVKQLINWEHTKYLNIWVVQKIRISTGGSGYVAGYSYYPGPGNNMDGVVILSSHTGGIGTSSPGHSTTLAHEVGHYLDLAHTWGTSNSCGNASNCWDDDGHSDTPNTIGNCSTCDITKVTCNTLNNVQNFMDYSSCKMMFTQDQSDWMNAALGIAWTGRQNLWSAANLIATGVNGSAPLCSPRADFFSSSQMVCTGTPVTFYDQSWNGAPSSWSWSFPGASITSSTNSSETVNYSTPGVYTVSLTVYNTAGGDSIGKTGFITVNSSIATHSLSTYFEGFEGASIPNSHWSVIDELGGNSWMTTSNTSYTGNKCIYLNNYSNSTDNTTDEFISKGFDLTKVPNPLISFMVAYAQKYNEDDKLEVYGSNDCGTTWSLRYSLAGSYLATVPSTTVPFTPFATSAWRKDYVNVSPFINSANVMFKFKFTGMGGNNIFIDDINLSSYYVGIEDEAKIKNSMSIYPNPLENNSVIKIRLLEKENVKLSVFDVTGRETLIIANREMNAGEYYFPLNGHALAKGIYLVQFSDNNETATQRVIVD